MAAKDKPNEFTITRLYDAPVELVWEAWTDPARVAQWWGPRGFSLTHHSKDLRAGGHWSYTMHGPDGTDYPNTTKYFEVEKYKRLVYDHGGHEDRPPLFRVRVTFEEVKGRTRMEMTMSMATAEAMAEMRKFIKQAGGEGTWDRLAEHLAEQIDKKDLFVINRCIEAPIEAVFAAWVNPEQLTQWIPPPGFEMRFERADIRPGGESFYSMENKEGIKMWGRSKYLEITNPSLISYTQQFCDADGKLSRHPFAPTWPETMLTQISFAAEGANRTRITVSTEIYGAATQAEREVFHQAKGGMTQGWTSSFDKLEAFLAR